MNEQIKQLAVQANPYFTKSYIVGPWYAEDIEKFAELIVRECAVIVEDSTWNLPHGYKAVDQANLVKQHFGVE